MRYLIILLTLSFINIAKADTSVSFQELIDNHKQIGCLFTIIIQDDPAVSKILTEKKYVYFQEGQNILIAINSSYNKKINEIKESQQYLQRYMNNPNNQLTDPSFVLKLNTQLLNIKQLTTLCK